MPDFYTSFVQELMATIVAVDPTAILPGTTGQASNIWTLTQSSRRSIVEAANKAIEGGGGALPPYWILDVGKFVEAEWGMDTLTYWAPVSIMYVDWQRNGHDIDQNSVSALLYALTMKINRGSFTTFQRVTQAEYDTSIENPVMMALAAESKVGTTFGGVVGTGQGLLVGETYS